MKIQSLAVIFIIIILPITLIINTYIEYQVKTVELQTEYDTKLTNATYDSLKAFQLNTINSSTSDLANSKIRDLEASINSFFSSVATNFNMAGYNKDQLTTYVPALVYTMYDGYYIYSPYTNTLQPEDYHRNPSNENDPNNSTYYDGQKLSGLKPYIFYSCRYITSTIDVVINYSLDNYITIKGTIDAGNTAVDRSGYLIDNISGTTYRGVNITKEAPLREYAPEYIRDTVEINDGSGNPTGDTRLSSTYSITGNSKPYTYIKLNGNKYYYDDNPSNYADGEPEYKWFYIMNGKRYDQTNITFNPNDPNGAAVKYYEEAREFTKWVYDNFGSIVPNNAVDENGNPTIADKLEWGDADKPIFPSTSTTPIEEPESNFNQHRLAIIRYSIEKNLSIAIANYNDETPDVKTDFRMPKLKEDEWDKIIKNISIISFMQGLNIGGKVYNGYSIITNTKNEEVVTEDSIYLITNDNQFHKPTDSGITNIVRGAFNTDFERKSILTNTSTSYFFPRPELGCYSCIVNDNRTDVDSKNIYKYLDSISNNDLKLKYYTALGRERYGMYRTENNSSEMIKNFN